MKSDELEKILSERLQAVHAEVLDDSAKHRGHAGARQGAGHFKARVVSPAFEGLAPVERHRRVYEALASEMKAEIHALSLKLYTPTEWAALQNASSGESARG